VWAAVKKTSARSEREPERAGGVGARGVAEGGALDLEEGYRRRISTAERFSCVPSMFDSLGVQVPYTT
jgi:hypothetical protein